MKQLACLVLAASIAGGCGDDGGRDAGADGEVTDGAADGGDAGSCDSTFEFTVGDPDGHAEPLGAGAGEARAGRIEASELPPDPDSLAVWEAGDFVLANDKVAVIIEQAGVSELYDPYGGKIVGLAKNDGGTLVEPADFNEILLDMGRFTVDADTVTVLNDGSDGEPAVVRSIGTLAPMPFIDIFARGLAPRDYLGIPVAMDFELAPDAEYVDIYFSFNNESPGPMVIDQVVYLIFQASRMPLYAPDYGFDLPLATRDVPWWGFVDDGATSYAMRDMRGGVEYFINIGGVSVFRATRVITDPCSQQRHHIARLYLGGPGLDGLLQARARSEGETLAEISGTVREPGGGGAEGVRVHALVGSDYVTRSAITDASGAFSLHVPSDAGTVDLTAWRRGNEPVDSSAAAGATDATLDLGDSGLVHIQAVDTDMAGLPARVQVMTESGPAPNVPASFGEPQVPGPGRIQVRFPIDGDVTVRAPAGRQRIVVSRGPEYELHSELVDVPGGGTADVTAMLDRVVDTTGVMCGDFHIHTHRSPDADDSVRFKVMAAIGDGVEIPVRSDHDWVADFEPMIAELGVQSWAFGIGSEELTTFEWGHMGVFPLVENPDAVNGGFVRWYGRTPSTLFPEVRGRPEEPAIIINHPRNFGGGIGGGEYFTVAGYDPDTATVANPDLWDEQFRIVEMFNDSDFEANRDETVRDWFSFLNHGRRVFGVGSSDSHEVLLGSPVGYPRTCLDVGTDDPEVLRTMGPNHVRDVALGGHMVVSGGIFITADARGGAGPGDDVTGAGDTEMVRVTVQAPSWIAVDSLEVIVDGVTTETIPIPATMDPLRFSEDIMIPVAAGGSWVIFHAKGDSDLEPVFSERMPFGCTNPIFFRH